MIILAHNARALITECLESVHLPMDLELIVVDNGSSDGTPELIARGWPAVRLIRNPTNLGVGRARNQGLAVSRGRFVLFLDQDARLAPGCLDRLLTQMDLDDRAGAVGPRLTYGDGRWQRWTAGRDLSLRSALNYLLFLDRIFNHPAFAGFYLHRDVRSAFQPSWVSGACILLRRAAVDQAGGFFEGGMNYMDDVDLCRRLRENGWRVWYAPQAQAIHLMAGGPGGRSAQGPVRDLNRYFETRHGRLASLALKAIEALGFGIRAAVYRAAAVVYRRPRWRAMAHTHWTAFKVAVERTS